MDEFEKQAAKWKKWHEYWRGIVDRLEEEDLATQQSDFVVRGALVRTLEELIHRGNRIFEAQTQVNAMMLAAIDDLSKRLSELEKSSN